MVSAANLDVDVCEIRRDATTVDKKRPYTNSISFQSYFFNAWYQTQSNNEGEQVMTMYNELQIESTRQFQTVVFYSQFLDANVTETSGKEVFESWSCSLSNVADAFDADGP